MLFDAQAALAKIEIEANTPATLATSATKTGPSVSNVAIVADVAASQAQNSEICASNQNRTEVEVLNSIQRGNQRPGAIATDTGLGATVTYQLLDRLAAKRQIEQAGDGILSVARKPACSFSPMVSKPEPG